LLAVVLIILKTVGTVLLVLLCIVLALLALILFVPVRYRVRAEKYDSFSMEAKVRWLLGLVRMEAVYGSESGNKLHICVKAAMFTLYDNLHPRKKKPKKKRTKPRSKPLSAAGARENTQKDTAAGPGPDLLSEPERDDPVDGHTFADTPGGSPEPESRYDGESSDERASSRGHSFFSKLKGFFRKAAEFPRAAAQRIRHLSDTLGRISKKKEWIFKLFEQEENHRWLIKSLARLKKFLLCIVPKADRLYLHFGFEDPSLTGRVLGALSILYPLCEDSLQLEPEFEDSVVEGEAAVHGHIRLIRAAIFAVPVFLNRRFFNIYKHLRHIINA